ncbi:MAG: FMN-binding negative transcriptional regulator [Proteobacteria bacterium]|nr:FMN-binding negative transcriptional regulator [Pseudomonadota bacterium]
MYVPQHFSAEDADALIARLTRRFAGVLVSADANGQPVATHMPVLWNAERRIATGHIARANPQWKLGAGRGLIVLAGPETYVSPSYYPSKAEHGKTVPTWNYEAVHLSGPVEWFDDGARLEGVVRRLSEVHENDRAEPWRIEDAPRAYIEALLRGIVGVEMRVERIEAKQKLSQNKSVGDFDGVVAGLEAAANPDAAEVAARMRSTRVMSDDPDGN